MLFVGVDASKEEGGAVLEQIGADGRRHPCRFESTIWSKQESAWHSTKLECKAVVWALKKFRTWLYGQHFTIETDAQTLIAQLNRSSAEVPGAIMNRWLGAILMWDFEIKHVPRKKNVVADALSRYPKPKGWEAPKEPEDDVEEFIENLIANVETGTP
jgi:ribonuclease HI